MENGALDIHDAAAWDDSALVAAYDAAIEKYEETHGGSSARTTAASRKHAPRATPPAVEEDTAAGSEAPADAEAEAAEAARLEAWARYYESQQPAPQAWTPAPAPGPAAGSSTPPWGASAPPPPPPQFLPGGPAATAPPAVAAAAAAAAATAVSGAPSDQHEADLTNLILAWYHTGFFTAVYQERHGRR